MATVRRNNGESRVADEEEEEAWQGTATAVEQWMLCVPRCIEVCLSQLTGTCLPGHQSAMLPATGYRDCEAAVST